LKHLDQAQWKLEEARLQKVYNKICKELAQRLKAVRDYGKTVRETGRTIWEEGDHVWEKGDIDAAVEMKQYTDALKQERQKYEIARRQLIKLERLEQSPWFGRVDFTEEGYKDTEQIYIGLTTFFDEKGDVLIYDWRAPISGIFYDFELGPAYYLCPEGIIRGQVSLKRQYRIEKNRIRFMLDTDMKIDDELLQEILSKSADEKMRNIVTTIQKEQNRIIRDENHQLLMVQGVAGSGKTSIALHRIAYLLYKYRDTNMTSGNILIFSPNTVFNDYISNVLPELGEENMQQTTFEEYLKSRAGNEASFESSSSHMEYVLTAKERESEKIRMRGIAYKSSMDFYHLLNRYAHYLEHNTIPFKDIYFKERILIPKKDIEKMFFHDYAGLPMVRRLEKLRQRLHYLIRGPWEERRRQLIEELQHHPEYKSKVRAYSRLFVFHEFKVVRRQIESILYFNVLKAYMDLFDDTDLFARLAGESLPPDYKEICMDTGRRIRNQMMGYEDISAYIYLKGILEGVPRMSHIRHVVVDEAQDYTPVQYGILRQLFNKTPMTLLGDFNQTIHPLKTGFGYEQVAEILAPESKAVLKLNKGYRSTMEIVAFTRAILNDSHIESIQRPGEKPKLIRGSDFDELMDKLVGDVKALKDDGFQSIGIICKTAAESQRVFDSIQTSLQVSLLTKDDANFSRGIIVLPVYLAKGLEFDGAMIIGADKETYGLEEDRKLFYTACTRALHRLHLYYTGEMSPFIKEISEDLYEVSKH
jgi:DNA helicase-2/ATP-dependent DNA helicase PcrA